MPTPVTWPYVAAFLDGEGWIGHTTHSNLNKTPCNRFRVVMTQITERDAVLYEIQRFLETQGIASKVEKYHNTDPKRRMTSRLVITQAKNVLKFLDAVYPFLWVKQDDAMKCILVIEEFRFKARRGNLTSRQVLAYL